MKYIAVLDTDDFEDFDFFEDGKEKYLHAIDATSYNGEWIYLPFRPLEQESILDKIRAEIEDLIDCPYDKCKGSDCVFCLQDECTVRGYRLMEILDKYKAETEVEDA